MDYFPQILLKTQKKLNFYCHLHEGRKNVLKPDASGASKPLSRI